MAEPLKSNAPSVPSPEPKPVLPGSTLGGPKGNLVSPENKFGEKTTTDTPRVARMKEVSNRVVEIQKEYGGHESDVPATHAEYWPLRHELYALLAQPEPAA
jgi:hypothetical protein